MIDLAFWICYCSMYAFLFYVLLNYVADILRGGVKNGSR